MVTLTILYELSEDQSPNRSNGERGPLSPVAARMSTGAVAGLALGEELPPWYGCFLSSLRQAYAPSFEQSWNTGGLRRS
jgi:hypothetical protein